MTKNLVRTVVGTKAERAVGGTVEKYQHSGEAGRMPMAGAERDVLVGAFCTVFIYLTVVEGWENFLVRLSKDTIKRGGFVEGLIKHLQGSVQAVTPQLPLLYSHVPLWQSSHNDDLDNSGTPSVVGGSRAASLAVLVPAKWVLPFYLPTQKLKARIWEYGCLYH